MANKVSLRVSAFTFYGISSLVLLILKDSQHLLMTAIASVQMIEHSVLMQFDWPFNYLYFAKSIYPIVDYQSLLPIQSLIDFSHVQSKNE